MVKGFVNYLFQNTVRPRGNWFTMLRRLTALIWYDTDAWDLAYHFAAAASSFVVLRIFTLHSLDRYRHELLSHASFASFSPTLTKSRIRLSIVP